MIQDCKPERVLISRHGETPRPGKTLAMIFLDKRNDAGEVIGRGAYTGTAVEYDDRPGLHVVAQADQMEPEPVTLALAA